MNGRGAERAVRILELLGGHARPVPAMMISRELGLPKSSTYHLLNVLKTRGFVAYHSESRAWNLGARAVEIAGASPTIGQAIVVLEAFDRASDRMTLSEVAARAGLEPEAATRVLAQLREYGLVVAGDGTYALGLRLAVLAARIAPIDRLRTAAHPFLVDLRDATEETANLLVRDGDSAVYLDQVESRHALRHAAWAGRRIPLSGSASGAALDGGCGAQVARNTIEPGVTAVACGLGHAFTAPAAVGITGPTLRLDDDRLMRCCRAVEETAASLAAALAGE